MPYTGSLQSVVFELSNIILNTASPLLYATTTEYLFWSIDGYYSTPNYLMNGQSMVDNVNLIYNMGQQGINDCLDLNNVQPTLINMIDIAHDAPFSVTSKKTIFKALKANKNTGNIEIDCSSKSNR